MKKSLKQLLSIMVVFFVAIAFIMVPATIPAHADSWGSIPYAKKITTIYQGGEDGMDLIINMGTKAKNAKKITVTSSNKKVAIPWKSSWTKLPKKYAGAVVKKPGTVTLTIKVTKKNNKSKKYKCTVTTFYENPLQVFSVGKMNLLSAFDSTISGEYKTSKAVTGKLSIAPKEGWVIDRIEYSKSYDGEGDEEDIDKDVQDGDTITLTPTVKDAEWYTYLYITVHNPEMGVKCELELSPYEDESWYD